MYDWRKMNVHEKKLVLKSRLEWGRPAHEPPHFEGGSGVVFITATNFDHQLIVGRNFSRLREFSEDLLEVCGTGILELDAFCVMKNHYHLLGYTKNPKTLRIELGRLHGRTSRAWNLEENLIGRRVWYRVFDEYIHANRKYYSILNYIHQNPVKKGYCSTMENWPFSSAAQFLKRVGKEEAERLQKEYPFDTLRQ